MVQTETRILLLGSVLRVHVRHHWFSLITDPIPGITKWEAQKIYDQYFYLFLFPPMLEWGMTAVSGQLLGR
jgi:hypothetical protein